MPARLARDETMTFFLAGHDTTAAVLTWTWHLLATHPDAADRMRAELEAVVGHRDPVAADIPRLTYAVQVLDEALRLYPPIGRIGRRPVRTYEIGGRRISAGAAIFVSPFVTQRDPRWWPDPDRFDPERWSADAVLGRPRYAAFPFGAGPRSCIGGQLARMIATLVIATVARRWRMHPTTARPPAIRSLLTLKPATPLRLRVTRIGSAVESLKIPVMSSRSG